ncbi:MAG TPA: asparaginase [Candidatus Limnocylindrales bacterium]|nr:asparaginase [Candidatus Limnocylindrales bacterium]
MPATRGTAPARGTSSRPSGGRAARTAPPPILVRQIRNGFVEAVHRGDVVEVDASGRMLHVIGDPDRVVNLRSAVKPFGVLALLGAHGVDSLDLTSEELALMASSHSGEDLHVRTLQAMYRRLQLSTSVLQPGVSPPLDALTAARLARDGERPGVVRHMCSGQHTVFILLCRLGDWPMDGYWEAEHPAQRAYSAAVAAMFGVRPEKLVTGIDGCGILTYAFRLREVAEAYAVLADPDALPSADPRATFASHLRSIRDAMRAHPELVAGSRDRLDTSLMKAVDGRVVSKSGMEGLRGVGILSGARGDGSAATGVAVKIEDGDASDRAAYSAGVEALRQVGVLDGQALRTLARYHRVPSLDPHGRLAAEAVPEFDLAPVGELTR